jgi:hypothetical protein
MFRKNQKHQQIPMFSSVSALPDAQRKLLDGSWAGVFYREFFARLDEEPFKVLYSDEPSRPNIPVNVLVALEVLKAGFGWSDEEMYEAYLFNLQVRYALGLHSLGDDAFDLRTVYYFRERLSDHMQKTGENLIEKAFEQVTDKQLAAFGLKTGRLRMDSTFVSSNIRTMSRLHLLVEMIQRLHRMLSAADQQRYAPEFASYVQGTTGQFLYHIKGQDGSSHIEQIGLLMARLLPELAPMYGENSTYALCERVFHEHYAFEQSRVRVKTGEDLNAKTLQSPDDPDATFRNKGGEHHVGYVTNITETCDPTNSLQLIVDVRTAPNVTDDSVLLAAALPTVVQRMQVDELNTDGGYNAALTRQTMHDTHVQHVVTALRGRQPQGLSLAEFCMTEASDGTPGTITCPFGQTASFMNKGTEWYAAHFAALGCAGCPHAERCPTRALKRFPIRALHVRLRNIEVAKQRRQILLAKDDKTNVRAAIEGTISALKRPYADGQLPVRRLYRVAPMMVARAAMANIRRLHSHLAARAAVQRRKVRLTDAATSPRSFVSILVDRFLPFLGTPWFPKPYSSVAN